MIVMVLIGGRRTLEGPIAGTVVLHLLERS
jgi:ABC-type branched-subunit amino acid transport system permease subunit